MKEISNLRLKAATETQEKKLEAKEIEIQGSLDENPEYLKIKREKRQLQCYLHQYQANFMKQHGRKVQYVQDREPVQGEYERYRVCIPFNSLSHSPLYFCLSLISD